MKRSAASICQKEEDIVRRLRSCNWCLFNPPYWCLLNPPYWCLLTPPPGIIKEHQQIFGPGVLQSVTTDKGYYSRANVKYVEECTGNADGIQRPANIKDQVQGPQKQELYNRRAGVEPLIGHIKRFGLGKSKMKSDRATLSSSSGYRSISGFNLHQLMRGITKNMKIQGLDGTTLTSNLTSISGFNPHQMKAQGTI